MESALPSLLYRAPENLIMGTHALILFRMGKALERGGTVQPQDGTGAFRIAQSGGGVQPQDGTWTFHVARLIERTVAVQPHDASEFRLPSQYESGGVQPQNRISTFRKARLIQWKGQYNPRIVQTRFAPADR